MDYFNTPASAPTLQSYQPPSLSNALSQYTSQQNQLPQLQGFANNLNTGSNQAYQQMLSSVSPNLLSNLGQFGQNTQSELNGVIPPDVMAQVQNSSAFQALQGGYGGSNMSASNTARNLGLTSLQLQQQGAQNLQQQTGLAQALNPSNVQASNMIYSPSTILSQDQQSDLLNNQIGNQNEQISYQNSLQRSPFDQLMTNNLATLMGVATNPLDAYSAMEGGGQQTVSNQGILSNASSGSGGGGGGMFGGGGGGGGAGGLMSLGGGCCFIFLESQNGRLPAFARLARDTRGTNATVRGYRWMSRWLVPAMRLWKPVKSLVNFIMVKPMLLAGEDYFTDKKSMLGKCCKPHVAFWFTLWTLLGVSVAQKERGRDAT